LRWAQAATSCETAEAISLREVYEKHTLSVARWFACVICITCCISARSLALCTRLRSPTMRTRMPCCWMMLSSLLMPRSFSSLNAIRSSTSCVVRLKFSSEKAYTVTADTPSSAHQRSASSSFE
jgi:hypothetical protein